jgi:hypothetical protein
MGHLIGTRWALAAILSAFFLAGCAGSANPGISPDPNAVAVSPKEPLFVRLPEIPDSILAGLAALGWGDGKFQGELRQEILFQFNRKGVPTVEDSSAAVAFLAVRIDSYGPGSGGGAAGYRGVARLRKAESERVFSFSKGKSRAEPPARRDPTVDNIRAIAESVVSGAWKPPSPDKPKAEPPVQLWMVF